MAGTISGTAKVSRGTGDLKETVGKVPASRTATAYEAATSGREGNEVWSPTDIDEEVNAAGIRDGSCAYYSGRSLPCHVLPFPRGGGMRQAFWCSDSFLPPSLFIWKVSSDCSVSGQSGNSWCFISWIPEVFSLKSYMSWRNQENNISEKQQANFRISMFQKRMTRQNSNFKWGSEYLDKEIRCELIYTSVHMN